MFSPDFISRLIGTVLFALLGARLGTDAAPGLGLPDTVTSIIFSMIGVLVGLLAGPYLIVRPLRSLRNSVTEMSVETLLTSLTGLTGGLLIALLLSYPLSQLQPPFGNILPTAISILFGYLGLAIFRVRSREITGMMGAWSNGRTRTLFNGSERLILLDTSVLIDGRVVDIAKTGFLGGTLAVPQFVINELHQVADSADPLRRARGKHGLENLVELQQGTMMPFKIIEEDVPGTIEVDDKLIVLATKLSAPIITNDYPLNRVAEAQGVVVLNVNALANAVRAMYIPGETFPIRIIQEGREPDQGVGYLKDGTMVVVEGGRSFMDRTIEVTVTRFINRDAGRMYFAVPEKH